MKSRLISIGICSLLVTTCFSQQSVDVLEGRWKVDGRDSFEVWEKFENGLVGYASRIKEGREIKTETLAIEMRNGTPVYLATVPGQNGGATIPFPLNANVQEMLSFENPEHDFPVKIQYKTVEQDRLFVQVLGKDGKGFSFYMDRVE